MKKAYSVTIGIPAHNEQNNIAALLGDIAAQNRDGWTLDSVVLFDDGSSDETVKRAMAAYPKIRFLTAVNRIGKSQAVDALLKDAGGDIIVLFDADVRTEDGNVITELVNAFRDDRNVMVAGGNVFPRQPVTFIERAIYSTFKVFYKSKKAFRGGNNIFGCVGSCMALRRRFAKSISMPDIVCDDAYIYMACVTSGYTFRYVDSAEVRYKLARTLTDHLKQQFRGASALPLFLRPYFGGRIDEELRRPPSRYLTFIWHSWIADPPATTFIIIVTILMKPFIPFVSARYRASFPMAQSTK